MTAHDNDEPAAPPGAGGLVRLRLDIAYDGTDFSGWAAQPGRRTVEATLADALRLVLHLPGPPKLTVAGRTDAGVHAAGQVAHVDVAATTDAGVLHRRLAGVVPEDVVVRRVVAAAPGFDARFSATQRRYCYRVCDAAMDPLRRRDTVRWPRLLDVQQMQHAAEGLLGENDFAAFCRPRPGASTIRTLHRLDVAREDDVVLVHAAADAFCHNQVRAMVGALLAVGEGRRPAPWPRQVLLGGMRDSAVTVAPARGLTLVGVDYPPDDLLADRAKVARARRGAD